MDIYEFLKFLIDNSIDFNYEYVNGLNFIWVYGSPTDIVGFNGVKKKYTPYIRISHFGEIRNNSKVAFIKRDGLCEWKYDWEIRNIILDMRCINQTHKGE